MTEQLALPFAAPAPRPPKGKPQRAVYDVLARGGWWMPHEIRDAIVDDDGEFYSELTVDAKRRDLRKPEHGGHVIEKRRVEGSHAYRYHLVGTPKVRGIPNVVKDLPYKIRSVWR